MFGAPVVVPLPRLRPTPEARIPDGIRRTPEVPHPGVDKKTELKLHFCIMFRASSVSRHTGNDIFDVLCPFGVVVGGKSQRCHSYFSSLKVIYLKMWHLQHRFDQRTNAVTPRAVFRDTAVMRMTHAAEFAPRAVLVVPIGGQTRFAQTTLCEGAGSSQ
jgi:hypothetical protein